MLSVQHQKELASYATGIREQLNIKQYPVYMETLITRHFKKQLQITPSPEVQPGTVRRKASRQQPWILHTNADVQTFEQQRLLNYKLARQMAQYLLNRYMQQNNVTIEDQRQAEDIILYCILLPEHAGRLSKLFPLPMLSTLFCLPDRVLKPWLKCAV